MRVSRCFSILTVATLAAAGCASPFSVSRKTADSASAALAATKHPAPSGEKPAKPAAATEKKDSPFVAEREKKAAPRPPSAPPASSTAAKTVDTSPSVASKPTETQPAAKKAAASGSGVTLSSEMLKLIDEELWDATPEERLEWYAQLKRVEPGMIPDILRARRLSMQLAVRSANAPSPQSRPVSAPPENASRAAGMNFHPQAATLPPSPTTIQQASYSDPNASHQVISAAYQTQAGYRPTVDQAIHYVDPRTPQPGVALQGFETAPAATPAAPIAVQHVQHQPPPQDQRAYAFSEPSNPGVPWPPNAKPAPGPASTRPNLTQPLSFGAGLVQNVVGLVPNRGTPASNIPNANPVQPAAMTLSAPEWRAELTRVIAALEQEISTQRAGGATDEDLRRQVSLRLLYLLADHQERALTAIPGLEPAEQEFWQQLVWGISNSLDTRHIARSEDRATQTITQLNTAVRRLQERADLQIRNVAFCRQILYFGNYERFPRDEFRPGQEVLLYAEIENFKSEPTSDGQYRTLLRSSLEILSPSGEVRKQIDFPATEDLCRNYRRDYFHNYQFTIPDRLPLGPHVLKLSVFDELSGKMTTYSVNFLVN